VDCYRELRKFFSKQRFRKRVVQSEPTRVGLQIEKESTLDQWDYFIWRPVMHKKALLSELKTSWTLDDLVVFHELQDIEDALTEESSKPRPDKP